MAAKPGINAWVYEYLHKHPDQDVYTHEMVDASDFTTKQVQNAVVQLMETERGVGIERVQPGKIYRYNTSSSGKTVVVKEYTPMMFEEIGRYDNKILIKDCDGNVYAAVKAKIDLV